MRRVLAARSGGLSARRRALWLGRWAFASAIILALLTTGAFMWVRHPSPPEPDLVSRVQLLAQRHCVGTEVVGLRGHGDPLSARSGAGTDTWALTEILRVRLGVQIELLGLPYAQGPDLFGLPISVSRDVVPAAAVVRTYIHRRVAACPAEQLVVIGQSEGAAVAHWAYPEIARDVKAVVLLGDPLHLASAPYHENLGNARAGQMVVWLALDPLSLKFRDRIDRNATTVRSYCLPHDQVCGFTPFDRHQDTHLEYRLNPPIGPDRESVLDRAADFVMRALANK